MGLNDYDLQIQIFKNLSWTDGIIVIYIYYDTILSTFTDVTDRTTKVVLETQGSLLRTICVICVYI